jgi:cation-transporting P-type ATPase 13A2
VKDLDPFASVSIVEELMSSGSLVPEKYKFFLGKNLVDLDRKSYFRLFVDEIAHPFNVFQIASIIIWLYEDYYLYALSIFLISVMSSGITLYETHTNNEKLRNISRFSCKIKILNHDKFLEIDSSELAPGNVVALDSSVEICPCDLILIKGDAIVDESMLTGESVPVSKVSLNEHSDSKFDFSLKNTSNAIYCGTKILRSRGTLSEPALGLVLKTGFETEKGQLILSILFPRPINFNFYSDSMKYIFILGVIAVLGFFLSLYNQLRLKTTKYYIFSRALDLITVVVPPALPATMSIGTVFSLNRLKRKMIHCISPSKINVSSKIDVFCFDKTGTLTEEGLDLYGIAPSGQENLKLQSARYLNEKYSDLKLIECMAVCHSLQIIDNILVGDPLEIKMFESSNWTLEENYDSFYRAIVKPPLNISIADNNGIGILRCFDFCSELRRTSVLTKNLSSDHFMAYCKGSPESILQICDQTSIPSNFESILQKYSKNGFRVIGCAQKNLSNYSNLNIMCLSREYIESKMSFLGFLIFENKIKKQSPKAICQLSLANIKTAMVTGDNILTAICVSRSCGIVRPNERVFLPSSETLISTFIDYDSNAVISFQDLIMQPESIVFACSGVFLKLLLSNVPHQTAEAFVKRCKIFARMSPEDKKLLVEFIQSTGLTVGFCGDGANDCGALKAADIGISLSDSEASVAAPFSSNSKNISCVISVLLEGRASLATSFSCFKFMALYSMIQFTSLILLYCFGSSLGDNQFVYIDLILILPLGMLMSRFQPSRVLVPKQPETKLISPSVLFSLLSQILYQALAQVYIYCLVIFQPEHEIPFMIPGQPNTQNQENTTVFLLSIFLYLFAATIFCSWKPFRSFYIPFYFYVFTLIVFTIFIIFNPKFGLDKLFEIVPISFEIKKSIVIVSSVYYCVSLLSEFFFKPKIIRSSWPVLNFNFNFKRNKI